MGGKILFGKRLNVVGSGTWGLPGGHLELDEGLEFAVKRELREETALEADELHFQGLVNDNRDDAHYIHINFIIDKWHGNLTNVEPDKCEEWKWFDWNELPEIFYGHKYIIKMLQENKQIIQSTRS